MENNGFNRFSDLWKKADNTGFSQTQYSKEDITKIKMKKSLDFTKSINKAIIFDYVLKGILLLGMLLLIWLYRTSPLVLVIIAGLIAISIYQIYREFVIRRTLLEIEDYAREIRTVLREKINFYKMYFPSLKWMLSFTTALLVWVGSMYYYYTKYGYYKMEDAVDAIVTFVMVTLAFGISYVAHSYQLKYNVLELEESLETLDDQQSASDTILKQEKRKRTLRIAMTVIATVGILLFILLLLLYFI